MLGVGDPRRRRQRRADGRDREPPRLGPNDPTETPEYLALPATCLDGVDNDADGRTDLEDPGCGWVAPATTFPPPGTDAFDSRLELRGFVFPTTNFGACQLYLDARGPVVVTRGAPLELGGGVRQIDTEIVALQLAGIARVTELGTCTIPPGDYPMTVFEDP